MPGRRWPSEPMRLVGLWGFQAHGPAHGQRMAGRGCQRMPVPEAKQAEAWMMDG